MIIQNKVLVVSTEKRFFLNSEGRVVDEDNTRSSVFWERYLQVFDKVIVIARVDHQKIIDSFNFVEGDNIKVHRLPNYQGAFQGLLKYRRIYNNLSKISELHSGSFFLLRLPGAIGTTLSKILRKSGIKYSVELVGNPYEVFASQSGFLSKVLANVTKRDIQVAVKHAKSVAYVTEKYLQSIFPHAGGFQTHYSSLELNKSFLKRGVKYFHDLKLSMVGVGNLEVPYKGVEQLLKSLHILKNKGIEFRLTWIGEGKLRSKYMNLAVSYGISEQVEFIGSVRNDQIFKYFDQNNLFVLPSLTEGLPRAMVEAMASKMICLGSNVGGIPELLDNDLVFKANDPQAIANKLIKVREDFERFKNTSERNFQKAKQYMPEELAKRRILFLKSVCDALERS